ncbi:PQQ-dependent sugar dehydrogenase [Aidingimonas lacisalsi]|uniref:PQQ-dependent sugar dehydrogenase n=1 Tax=Aidingimonas lacisalsi TaxID=2604086 RepID=UPI0011D2B040|nr:PQQ-dependent sugar dehydrogenase [Aidingimonas lacisalsi]
MKLARSTLAPMLLAIGGLATLGITTQALAQDDEPAWAQGRPDSLQDAPMAPHAGKMTQTPKEELPLDHIRLPDGFNAEVWAHGMPGARMMALGDEGTLFLGTRSIGRVYAVMDNGDERETMTVANGLTQPNGVAFKDGSLYVAAINEVYRYDDIESHLADGNVPEPVELTDEFDLPDDEHHGWKFLAFGPDDRLYVPVGAPCNGCDVDADVHATIRSYEPDGTDMRIEARGVRNTVGFDFHPETGELWFTDNNQDWISQHIPSDELNRISESGEHFGFPACHANGFVDPERGSEGACDDITYPAALMGPHTAPLGMRFYQGDMFPDEYRNAMFIARHGSWNRTMNSGFDVKVAMISDDGDSASTSTFMDGFLDPRTNEFSGRPTDVQELPDGSLLVSDDQNGAVYRITYEAPDY